VLAAARAGVLDPGAAAARKPRRRRREKRVQTLRFERVKARLHTLPQVAAWPQMLDLVERTVHRDLQSIWEFPVVSCMAVGGAAEAALPAAAAVLCSLLSIHLVDDLLDDDPGGDFRRLGAGPVANLGVAFQAAAHCLIAPPATPPEMSAELHACLGRMSLATAFGQHLDSREVSSEEEYWQVVGTKTPPLFAMALRLGALLGGAPAASTAEIERLGSVLGMFVQVSDDLADALRTPAGADWQRRANNLPILYAMVAEHPAREEFLALSGASHDPVSLAAAQKILLQCGAVSYCAYRMSTLAREARNILDAIPLVNPEPLARLLAEHLRPLDTLLSSMGHRESLTAAPA
jgi:geranylgeranyl diphosphate synthase type I